jgi:predicted short-subunit dehydrogenase-like oxidoreductase (DUF2520 family)
MEKPEDKNLEPLQKKFLIVGAGNVGTSLYLKLSELYPGKVHLYGRLEWNQFDNIHVAREDYTNYLNPEIVNPVETIFVCVPDDRIKEATRVILMFRLMSKTIFHTSGAKDSSELDHLKNRNAYVASLHPLQSFPVKFLPASKWENIIFAFEGDEIAYTVASAIIEKMNSTIIRLNEDQKVAMHIAGVFASNYFIGLLSVAEGILTQAGITEVPRNELLQPLVQGVVDNYKKSRADDILSGPLKRGDINVIRKHIQYLRIHKSNVDLYVKMAKVLLKNPQFNIPGSAKLEEILDKYR